MTFKKIFFVLAATLMLQACGRDDNDRFGNNNNVDETLAALPETVTYPADNPYSLEKEQLGRLLFWDPILSGSKDIACASCHHPDLAYADGLAFSQGVNGSGLGPNRSNGVQIKRNSPTIINTAFNGLQEIGDYNPNTAPMFWDNRNQSLEEQALQPMLSKEEMRGEGIAEDEIVNLIIQRLNDIPAYQSLFESAFGTAQIDEGRIMQAIATFERSIVSNNSRFDQYMRGDEAALSDFEIEGMNRFLDAGCANCHSGPMLSDYELHTLGVRDHGGITDEGATGGFEFRTPSLRNLSYTAPYMHNGFFDDLEDVLEFYDDISDRRANQINNNVSFNEIDDDARDLNIGIGSINRIVAFLKTLDDNNFDKTIPDSVPSQLKVGGDID